LCAIAVTIDVTVISFRLSYCCLLAVWYGTNIVSLLFFFVVIGLSIFRQVYVIINLVLNDSN